MRRAPSVACSRIVGACLSTWGPKAAPSLRQRNFFRYPLVHHCEAGLSVSNLVPLILRRKATLTLLLSTPLLPRAKIPRPHYGAGPED
ncbi:hypothetical protein BDV41DRAFT_533670 [Aspergillus transmontanensis]|uniref:Uncharacterized protein n=1 Tax=Aspergillus transmontanensis TaxID=1034304 RepID=A0A5N6W1I0_9EURO|nr:hypothetical protein BDV41DRAFT_533670 [Aspergillus transmontanensis]